MMNVHENQEQDQATDTACVYFEIGGLIVLLLSETNFL